MAVNKVVINTANGEETLIDLTNDSVTADSLVVGFTAHNKSGGVISGANPYAKANTDAVVNDQASLISQIMAGLEGKAIGGGNASGGSVETCTVQVVDNMTLITPTFYYTDVDFTLKTKTTKSGSFKVPKNTIVAMSDWEAMNTGSGGCTEIFEFSGCAAYQITADCTFSIQS